MATNDPGGECVNGIGWLNEEKTIVDNTEGTAAYDDLGQDALRPGTTNFDNGGCSLDINTVHLSSTYGVTNHVYDKMKRSSEHNSAVMELVRAGRFDTSTSNSVLNVLESDDDMREHIRLSFLALKPGGRAYFKIWRGNASSIPNRPSRGYYQRNQLPSEYASIIETIFCPHAPNRADQNGSVKWITHLNLVVATKGFNAQTCVNEGKEVNKTIHSVARVNSVVSEGKEEEDKEEENTKTSNDDEDDATGRIRTECSSAGTGSMMSKKEAHLIRALHVHSENGYPFSSGFNLTTASLMDKKIELHRMNARVKRLQLADAQREHDRLQMKLGRFYFVEFLKSIQSKFDDF